MNGNDAVASPNPPASSLPSVAVVLPVYNACEQLPRVLQCLRAQDYVGPWEIVAVDNGSTDGSIEVLRQAQEAGQLRLIHEKTRGPSPARNAGVRVSQSEIVAFIDSDCFAAPEWLRLLVAAFEDAAVWAAGGHMESAAPETIAESFTARQGIMNTIDFYRAIPYKPPFLLTANFAVRREVFNRLNGFDETFRVGEDADFCWRLQQAGGGLAFVQQAVVEHKHRSSLVRFARQMFTYGMGSAATFSRHKKFIGHSVWIDGRSWYLLAKSIPKSILFPFIRRDRYYWCEGPMEFVRYTCFLAGRIVGSVRYRVVVL